MLGGRWAITPTLRGYVAVRLIEIDFQQLSYHHTNNRRGKRRKVAPPANEIAFFYLSGLTGIKIAGFFESGRRKGGIVF